MCFQEADSDDEWQGLIETTDPECAEPDTIRMLLSDKALHVKLRTMLMSSSVQVMDAVLEGASRLRYVLRVITNLIGYKWYVVIITIYHFYLNIITIDRYVMITFSLLLLFCEIRRNLFAIICHLILNSNSSESDG